MSGQRSAGMIDERSAEPGAVRSDWRDTVRVAADVALLGIVLTAAVLPVITAGAAVATASAAMHHFVQYDRWPGLRASLSTFLRCLLPGLAALAVCAATILLLVINVLAVRSGAVPGGAPLMVLTVGLALAAVGYAGLVVVAVGVRDGRDWPGALRVGATMAMTRPAALPAAAGVLALAALLALLIHPALVPVLAGCALLALHAVTRRIAGSPRPLGPPARVQR